MESLSISSVAGITISEIDGDFSNLKYLNFDQVMFDSYARDQLAGLLRAENKLFGLELRCRDLSSIVDILSNNDKTKGLRTLNLTSAQNITLIPSCGNLHTLCLRKLDHLLDVSSLANIHTLYIISCDRLTDVSQLGKVYKLCLAGCKSIEDVSALGSVSDLNLSFCKSIKDFSSLGRENKILNLRGTTITDLSRLGSVEKLDISYCRYIDVETLNFVARTIPSLVCVGINQMESSEKAQGFYHSNILDENFVFRPFR